jgi:hypothetical protein
MQLIALTTHKERYVMNARGYATSQILAMHGVTYSSKPSYTFKQYREMNPGDTHTKETYCAGKFTHREVPDSAAARHGTFKDGAGYLWRVVLMLPHYIYAVPASYVENYWE